MERNLSASLARDFLLAQEHVRKRSQRKDLRTAMTDHSSLRHKHTEMLKMISEGTPDLNALGTLLTEADDEAHRVQQYSATQDPRALPFSTVIEKSASKACKVFGIAELVEMISAHLNIRERLAIAQVDKQLNALMSTSPTLCPNGAPPSQSRSRFASHFGTQSGFTTLYCKHSPDGPLINYFLAAFDPDKPLPTIGTRCKAMQIFNPPVKELDVILMSGQDFRGSCQWMCREKISCIAVDTGITAGHLLDTAIAVRQERSGVVVQADDATRNKKHRFAWTEGQGKSTLVFARNLMGRSEDSESTSTDAR